MGIQGSWFFVLLPFFLFGSRGYAGEGLFNRAYTVETVPEGHYEFEQLIRNRTHRAYGQYSADDLRSEFEYGVTDNFQAALYVNTEYLYASNAPDDNDPAIASGMAHGINRNEFFLQSLSAEFIYRITSPISSPIGIAFYYEPEWDFYDMHNGDRVYDSMENEYRVLFQKNFLDDQFILVYNFIIETEYFRYGNGDTPWQGELDWNNEIGATYRFAPNWYGGLEARNHNEVGNFWHHDHSVYWAGPALHYGGPKFWATFGFLAQVYGWPSRDVENGNDQGPPGFFLHSHEMLETTVKFGIPL